MRWWIRAALAVALLAPASHADDIDVWLRGIDSYEEKERAAALEALRKRGASAFDRVAERMRANNRLTRLLALGLLVGYTKEMEDIDARRDVFLAALEDPREDLSDLAVTAFAKAGPETVAALFGLATGKRERLAQRARAALACAGARAAPHLAEELKSKKSEALLDALELVAWIGPSCKSTFPQVAELTRSSRSEVRMAALRALGSLAPESEEAGSALIDALDADDPATAVLCARLIGSQVPGAAQRLVGELEREPSLHGDRVRLALRDAVDRRPLLALLDSKRESVRVEALRLLTGANCCAEALPRARAALASGSAAERIAAARLIACNSADEADLKTLLPSLLGDKQREVGDWAWFRAWWDRAATPEPRHLTDPEVRARTHATGGDWLASVIKASDADSAEAALPAIGLLVFIERAYAPGTPNHRSERVAKLPKPVRDSCEHGWQWLALHQSDDGTWAAGQDGLEIGTTAYALLAFSAGGHNDRGGPYAASIRRGIAALLQRQNEFGLIGTPAGRDALLQHQIAAAALLDAYLVGSCPAYIDSYRTAVEHMFKLQLGDGGFGYEPVKGKSDLYRTTWAAYVARLGALAGVLPLESYGPRLAKYAASKVDPEFGQFGYQIPGGMPARTRGLEGQFPAECSQSMTAAGLWTQYLVEDMQIGDKLARKAFDLIGVVKPVWKPDSGRVDYTYWHFAANAWALASLQPRGNSSLRKWDREWRKALVETLLPNQEASGAWPAVDPWGDPGGVTYSTASCVLALLAPAQFSEDFHSARRSRRSGDYRGVHEALEKALRSKNPRVALAAAAALE